MDSKLNSFRLFLNEETEILMDEYSNRIEAFTSYILDRLSELMNLSYYSYCNARIESSSKNILGEIFGYAYDNNNETLTLFYTKYDGNSDDNVKSVTSTDYQTIMSRMQGFYERALRGYHIDIDEDNPSYYPAKYIYDNHKTFTRIRLCVLSNMVIEHREIKNKRILGVLLMPDIWDIKKLQLNINSETERVPILVDLEDEEYKNYKIPYIKDDQSDENYTCFLAMVPGKLLYKLYEMHNTDLLTNNVRYFLGFKGTKKKNVNAGIRETLREKPQMFLAYNNGITAVAEHLEVEETSNRTGFLKRIHDFQIVNGGQTTASIFFSKKEDKTIELIKVFIQVKIILVKTHLPDLIANITKYSNFQNVIKYADYTINNNFNLKFQELSRTIYTPIIDNNKYLWYFERVRGQYEQEIKNQTNKHDQQYFMSVSPKHLRFNKELISKVWRSWEQMPFDAVKGEGTCYDIFISEITTNGFIPDEIYYKKTIALIIIYQYLRSRPENKLYANKKAAVICYTIAYLNFATFGKLDLIKIWQEQSITDNIKIYLNNLSEEIKNIITREAGEQGVLSYSKRKSTLERITQVLQYNDIKLIKDSLTYDN